MPSPKNYSELVEAYLDGELSSEEHTSFEKELEVNAALKQELAYYQMAQQGIVQHKIAEVQNIVEEVQHDYKLKAKQTKFRKGLIILGGTSLLAALLWGVNNNPTSTDKNILITHTDSSQTQKDTVLLINNTKTQKPSLQEEQNQARQKVLADKITHIKTGENIIQPDTVSATTTSLNLGATDSVLTQTTNNIHDVDSVSNQLQERKDTTAAMNVISCADAVIQAEIATTATCKGSEDGQITLKQIAGGKAPYEYELSTGERSSNVDFSDLAVGEYTLTITDKNGCQGEEQVEIEEKLCKLNLYYNPNSNEALEFPEYDQHGTLSIYDKNGVLKFTQQIEANTVFSWYGNSNDGSLAPGYYIIMIKFENGKVQNGSLTITP